MSSESQSNGETQRLSSRIAELERELSKVRQENAELRESDEYWRSLVRAAPVYLAVVDREHRFLFLNRTAAGYRPDEVIGSSIAEITAPEHRAKMQAALDYVLATGETTNVEVCDFLQRRWYSCTFGPLYRGGKVAAVVQCSEDITEKQEMQRQLSEAESRWRTLLNSAPDMIVLVNSAGQVKFINRTTDDYVVDEVVGQRGIDFLSPADRAPLEKALGDVFATGEPRDIEITEQRGGRTYLGRIAMIGSFEGEPMAIALLRDITKERQRQQELLNSETQLRLAVERAPMVIWTTDRELRFTSSMGAGLKLLNVEPNASNGILLYDYFGSRDPELPAIKAHLAALQGASVEYTQVWSDVVFQSHVEPLRNAQGEVVGLIGIALDITARHATEAQLRQTGSDLEHRVRERTAELDAANQKLRIDIEHRRIAEQELRESEERLRIITEGLPVAVLIVRRGDQRVLYVNQQACDLYGATAEQLLSGSISLPCGDPTVRQYCLKMPDQEHMLKDHEVQSFKANGTPIWVSISMVGIKYQGDSAYLCGMLDTTRRKEAEAEILADRRLLTQLLDMNDRDRQLIAYEIHDGFVQDVTAAVMFLESAQAGSVNITHQVAVQMDQSLELLRQSLEEARRLISGLRPPVLEEAGVVAAVEELIHKMHEQFGMNVELEAEVPTDRMAPALEMAVYRIIQEALNNAQRHSGSMRVYVYIGLKSPRVKLEIRDWGCGFEVNKTPKKRYGLTGMQERASLLGGETRIESQPGTGTRIRVDLPLVSLGKRQAPVDG